MRSFPDAAREITATRPQETCDNGGAITARTALRKNLAKPQSRFAMHAQEEHNKYRKRRGKQQGGAVAQDKGGVDARSEQDEFGKVPAKKKSCRIRSGFLLVESLPVIRAIKWAISFALVIDSACGLRLTNMTAPVVADTRNDMLLDCHFDMGAELLYAVKWYKDDQEFFRFRPNQQPHTIMFPVAGVHMQATATQCDETRCMLRLTNLTREHSGGAYRCEVSTEAPAFRLASETHNVTVATLPLDLPRITGLADTYAMDDMLTLECVSGAGDPTPQLTWYINNQPAPAEILGESYTTQVKEKSSHGDRITSSNGISSVDNHNEDANHRNSITLTKRTQPLRMRIERRHLQMAGAMMVQCVSTLPAMHMVQPQTVGHTVIVRSKAIQVSFQNGSFGDHNADDPAANVSWHWFVARRCSLSKPGLLAFNYKLPKSRTLSA